LLLLVLFFVSSYANTTDGSGKRDMKCETCQTVVYDVFARFTKRAKSKTAGMDDHAILSILDSACQNLGDYADKADIATYIMNENCEKILPKIEEFLEEALPRRGATEAKAREICVRKKFCTARWTAGDEPHFRESKSERNLREGKEYMSTHAKQEDVTVLPSGIQYKVLTTGAGVVHPGVSDTVKVHYAGHLTNGDQFDSSYARGDPAEFPLNGVIKGWTEILQLMVRGDIWEVVIPGELAYGLQGGGEKIGPNAALVFKIELLEIKGKDPLFVPDASASAGADRDKEL